MPQERDEWLIRLHGAAQARMRFLCMEDVSRLLERLEPIGDPGLRGRAFLGCLASMPGPVIVEMLHSLELLAVARVPAAQKLFLDILGEEAVRGVFGQERIADLTRLGRLRGYRHLVESFFHHSTPADFRFEEAPRLPPDIRDIPLGRRKAMARMSVIGVLERLLGDNDVSVIRALLANPRTTEREVVRLAAKRPNSAAILAALAADRRWVSRYAVRKALVYNPETPIRVSVPLLKFLFRKDLLELSRFHSVNAVLKRAARELLEG